SLTGSRMELTHIEQNLPGFSVMFVLLSLIFSVAFGLRDEEVWGTSDRLSIAPVSQATILGGKLLARLVVGTAQLLILLLFAHFVYGMSLGRSPVSLFLISSIIVFSMACFAVIVAALARTREQIIPVGMSAVFILAALGGCWWPVYAQPKWMQAMGQFVMTTWSMFAIQDVMFRDKNLLQIAPTVLLPLAFGVGSFAVGARLFRYTENCRPSTSSGTARGKSVCVAGCGAPLHESERHGEGAIGDVQRTGEWRLRFMYEQQRSRNRDGEHDADQNLGKDARHAEEVGEANGRRAED